MLKGERLLLVIIKEVNLKIDLKLLKWVYCLSVGLFLYLAVVGQAEVITIEEFFNTAMPSKAVTKAYSYEMRDEFSTARYCRKYLAITNQYNYMEDTPNGLKKTKKSSEIDIYSATERKSIIANEAEAGVIIGFSENKNRVISYYKEDSDKPLELGIFDINGTLLNTIPYLNGPTYCSPGGEFFYVSVGEHLSGSINIYDSNGDLSFRIGGLSGFKFVAPTDTSLLVLTRRSLTMWNINTQQKVWESEIPNETFYTSTGNYKITYSLKSNIIVVRDNLGCYCFDFQGNFLWSHEGPSRLRDNIRYVGVCEENGNVATIFNMGSSILLKLFNRNGILLNESEINCHYRATYGSKADVFPNYILMRYEIRENQNIIRATAIFYNNGQEWTSSLIDGYWFLLHYENGTESLVGFDNESNVVSAYNIE